MNPEFQPDPFTLHAAALPNAAARAVPAQAIESAWFDAPRRSSAPRRSVPPLRAASVAPPSLPPPPPIDDAIADAWFR